MSQVFVTVLVLILGALLGIGLAGRNRSGVPAESAPVIVGNIETLADLVVLRVPLSKVQCTRIGGYLGGIDCILLINGEVEISSDLTQARWDNVNKDTRTAILILKEPEVRRVRLDHQQTSIYTIDRRGLWTVLPTSEPTRHVLNRAMHEAEDCVESAGEDAKLIERSKKQTEVIVARFVESLGWEVEVIWCDDSSETCSGMTDIPDG